MSLDTVSPVTTRLRTLSELWSGRVLGASVEPTTSLPAMFAAMKRCPYAWMSSASEFFPPTSAKQSSARVDLPFEASPLGTGAMPTMMNMQESFPR